MPLSSEHAVIALQMFRKSVGLDRTLERKVSQSWRTRSSRASPIELNMVDDVDDSKLVTVVGWIMMILQKTRTKK